MGIDAAGQSCARNPCPANAKEEEERGDRPRRSRDADGAKSSEGEVGTVLRIPLPEPLQATTISIVAARWSCAPIKAIR